MTMRVSRHFTRLGIDGSSHRNRHLYGTELLRGGANLRVVQELMRHADLTTTVRYLGVDQEEKVAAIRRLSA
jgi:integrase/recombinase XerD